MPKKQSDSMIHSSHTAIMVVIGIAAILTILLVVVRAATSYIGLEGEVGEVSEGLVVDDATASGNKALLFNEKTIDDSGCSGVKKTINPPASDFAQTVASDAENTCYSLVAGTYTFSDIKPKNGMQFIGAGMEKTIINGSGKALGFFGNSSKVTIKGVALKDFNRSLVSNPQGQGAIMGVNGLELQTDASQRAKYWTVDAVSISGSPGSGLIMGDYFVVKNSTFTKNVITGIAGGNFLGGLIENNALYDNGFGGVSGQGVNGAGMKFGSSNEVDDSVPFIIRKNIVHDNDRRGIWCDLDCRNTVIEDNTVYNQRFDCIFIELGRNAIIRNNTIDNCQTDGGGSGYLSGWNGGALLVADSGYVEVYGNTIKNSAHGLTVQQLKRPAPGETWQQEQVDKGRFPNRTAHHITFKNNTLINVKKSGASHGTSANGETQYDTIKFEGNDYSQSPGIELWFNRQKYDLNTWRSSLGFDL